ncbi:hypothetical protein F5Y17DRAFT_282924 [Xylariaceae sp. FL0594]|nr:hypothetical protein F5Y17DRAFT_282924 [Xylariaceae sp. FL0594]
MEGLTKSSYAYLLMYACNLLPDLSSVPRSRGFGPKTYLYVPSSKVGFRECTYPRKRSTLIRITVSFATCCAVLSVHGVCMYIHSPNLLPRFYLECVQLLKKRNLSSQYWREEMPPRNIDWRQANLRYRMRRPASSSRRKIDIRRLLYRLSRHSSLT